MHPVENSDHRTSSLLGTITALLVWILAASGLQAQTAARLFDDSSVQDIYINVNPQDWQTLRDNYLLDTYYPAQFIWNGLTAERAAIRSRGSGSRSPEKPNLLVAFNRNDSRQRFLGLTAVVVKANNQDASLLREILAMKLFRRMGIPAPLEAPARLFVNGEFFGAYTLVENMDEAFLQRNFGETTGYLYDWQENRSDGYRFEYLGPDPALYVPAMFDPKTNKSNPDAAGLVAMVQAINFASDAEFVREVSRYIDLKHFMTYLATENFLSDYDGFLGRVFGMNNLYFYRPPDRGPGIFTPWDKDGTFNWEGQGVFDGVNENVLARRAMQVAELRRVYLGAFVKAAELAGGPGGWMDQEAERLYRLIENSARADLHKQCSQSGVLVACDAADFEQGVEGLRRFIRVRSGIAAGEALAAGYRPAAAAPRLLEDGVINAAGGPFVAAGSLASLYGQRLAAATARASDSAPPHRLGDVVVAVNGARAPLLFVSPEQVNAQISWELTPGPVPVTVFVDGEPGNTVLANIAEFAPGIFVVVHGENLEPITELRPAAVGETLMIYATGLGPAAGVAGTWPTRETPIVTVGGQRAEVESSELLPDSAGLYRVRIRVPSGVDPGFSVPLALTIGGQTTEIAVAVGEASAIN